MILRFLLPILLLTTLDANIYKQIATSKKELTKNQKNLKRLNKKLYYIAKEIKKEKTTLQDINNNLTTLKRKIEANKKIYQENLANLKVLKENENNLTKNMQHLKEALTILVAKYFSKSIAAQNLKKTNLEDVINEELLKAIKKSQKSKILDVSKKYKITKNSLLEVKSQIKELQNRLSNLEKKSKNLITLKEEKKKILISLDNKEKEYKQSIENLLKEQKSLRETLNRLKILTYKPKNIVTKTNKVKVRKLGKSYEYVKTLKYRGPKTMPPLKKFVIVKRYGNYIDPIYKIKIFNESIELKPLIPNEKVRSVLNGKVILAKRTPSLDNVIIIKHRDGLYTIYANIDKIAPTIKKGRFVRKGYVIGRVTKKLTFEVTKKRYHINPLDLIKID